MSSLIVRIVEFSLSPHSNADSLSLANPVGTDWQCVIKTQVFAGVKTALYVPIDSMVPSALALEWGLPEAKEGKLYRIRTKKFRQELSQGLLIPNTWGWEVGFDAAETLGITKWEPKLSLVNAGGVRRNPEGFNTYTDIENIKNFPNVFKEGDYVIATEKLHGTNFRAGWIESGTHKEPADKTGYEYIAGELVWQRQNEQSDVEWVDVKDYTFYVGSHHICLKEDADNHYTRAALEANLAHKLKQYPGYIVFGEIYGPGIQKMQYGLTLPHMRVFDVWNGSSYLSYDLFEAFCRNIQLPVVPILYKGPYSSKVLELRKGEAHSGDHIREGIVIRPAVEYHERGLGRVILKCVSEDYLLGNYDMDEVG